jgi:hypothetical protein
MTPQQKKGGSLKSPLRSQSQAAMEPPKDEVILRLKQTNANLRAKLKEFSQILDQNIQKASNGHLAVGRAAAPAHTSHQGQGGNVQGIYLFISIVLQHGLVQRQMQCVFHKIMLLFNVLQPWKLKFETYSKKYPSTRKLLNHKGDKWRQQGVRNIYWP